MIHRRQKYSQYYRRGHEKEWVTVTSRAPSLKSWELFNLMRLERSEKRCCAAASWRGNACRTWREEVGVYLEELAASHGWIFSWFWPRRGNRDFRGRLLLKRHLCQTVLVFFPPQIRVDGNNERSVQHSSGGRGGGGGGPSSSQGGIGSSGEGPSRHHHQRPIRDRGMKKDKQDAPPLVNGVS